MHGNIEDKVTTIGSGAFLDCSKLEQVSLPASLTSIGNSVFQNCIAITSLTIPESITSLSDYLFDNCSSLNSVSVSPQLSAIGAYSFAGTGALASFEIPATVATIGAHAFDGSGITGVTIPSRVTAIEEGTFAHTSALAALVIPGTVISIGNGAFDDCSALVTLNIEASPKPLTLGRNDAGEGLFKDCGLDNLYIGRTLSFNSDEANGYSPFYGNTTLKNVSVGENAISVPENMFRNCSGLEDVNLAVTVTSMGSSAFRGSGVKTINFPSKLTIIPTYAFADCQRLSALTIPSTVTRIDKHAFDGSGLQSIVLPASIGTVDEYVLANTSNLQSVELAEGITAIGDNAFSGSKLPSILIPNTIKTIGNGAFKGCDALAEFIIADGTEQLSLGINASQQGLFFDCPLTTLYQGRDLKYSTSSVSGISPFYSCSTLQSVEIGDIPTKVESKQFYNCTALTTVKIGDSVTSIGDFAFSGCSALEQFAVGASIENIGADAFSDCTGMTELRTYAPIPPYCGDQALGDIDKFSCTLYVPQGSEADYSAAEQWNEFFFVEGFDAGVNVSYINLSHTTATLNVGENMTIEASVFPETALVRAVDWSSSNTDVAIVNAQGVVTALAEGQTDIVATAKDGSGASASCLLTVFNPNKPVAYQFQVEDAEITASRSTIIAVSLKNEAPITSFQCDIHLPAGVEIEMNEQNRYAFSKGARLDETFVMTSADYNNAVRLLVYSSQNLPADGTDGVLFYIPVKLTDSSTTPGTQLSISITDISVTLASDLSEVMLPQVDVTLTVAQSYTPGDVNGDGRFSAADVSMAVSYVLGDNPANGVREAADANGDGRFSAADVSIIVSYVLAGRNASAPSLTPMVAGDEKAFVDINDNGTLKIGVDNLYRYVAAQMDVNLPSGISVKSVQIADENADSHEVNWTLLPNGTLRLLSYSPSNSTFRSSDALVEIELEKYAETESYEFGVDSVFLTEIEYTDGEQFINEYAVEGFNAKLDVSGIPTVGANGLCVVRINGQLYTLAPDADGNIIFCDVLGRLIYHNVYSQGFSINLVPGVYIINNNKLYIK